MLSHIQTNLLRTTTRNLEIFRNEMNVTPEKFQEKVDRVKKWYKNQPHLPRVELDHDYLIRNLSVDKFDEERTMRRLETYLTSKTMMPEYFEDRDTWSDHISKGLESLDMVILPSPTDQNHRVSVLKLNIDSRDDYDLDAAFFCIFMLIDIRLHTDTAPKDVLIWDFENLTFAQIKRMRLQSIQNLIFILQKCYGAPIQNIHVINAPPVAELVLSIAKAAMKKKISDRFLVHSSMENFHQVFPKKYLPKDMGGDEPLTLKEIANQWGMALKTPEMRQWFLDFDKLKSDESKRLGKKDFIIQDHLGAQGTFKKIEID